MTGPIGLVLKGYPRLSETFIAQEIEGLEARGADFVIISLRHSTDTARHPVHGRIKAPVLYLPEYLHHEPLRVLRAAGSALSRARLWRTVRAWLKDLARDPTRNRIRRFGQALVLAAEASRQMSHLHAHFLHTPSSVARYASLLLNLPWSVSAHAVDIWTTPDWEIRSKLAGARFAVTCTRIGRDHLARLAPRHGARVHLAYHGLDWRDVPAAPPPRNRPADGTDPDHPVRLITVARAVEKKGLDGLLRALAHLPAGRAWTWTLIGGGPLAGALRRQAAAAGLAERITWMGAQPREVVFDALRRADLFILPSRIGRDGNRDGLPNVLMEAMSQGLTCLSSEVSAIPELITHGETGWLVPPGNDPALAEALEHLASRPDLRQRLGTAGQAHVRTHFGAETGLSTVAGLLGLDP
ncbi:MAG: glycosyltransferase family 4 protein [Alphaproteobacteria bacterium]